MSSLLSNSPRSGSSASTADKLKSFGSRLNRGFGIAKRWTLEKVGAKESEQEAPEVAALLTAFQQDKADLDELRAKVQHIISTERALLESDKSFAQQLAELQVAMPDPAATDSTDAEGQEGEGNSGGGAQSALSTIDSVSSAFAAAPTGSTSSSASTSEDASTAPAPSPAASATRHPPFTPETFSTYLTHLHAARIRYVTALSSSLLEPIDLLLTQDVTVCATMIKQLPLLRLDHAAKQDRADKLAAGSSGEAHELAVQDEKDSREVYEAQLEVVEKLARELHVKLDRTLHDLCDRYVSETERWYASQQAVIEEAVRDSEGRMQPVGGVLDAEPTGVKDVVDAVVDKLDQLGGKMIDEPSA